MNDRPANNPLPEAEKPSAEPEVRHVDGRIEHPAVGFERTDVPSRWVLIVAIVSCAIGVAAFFVAFAFYHMQARSLAVRRASDFPLATHPSDRLPPEPRLEQIDRRAEIETPNVFLREQAKEAVLHGYGPTQEPGFVHVPIEQTMQTLAGHLPVRKSPAPSPGKDNGLLDAGEPNSGRLFRGAAP